MIFLLIAASAMTNTAALLNFTVPANYTIDVHSHIIPDFFRDALIAAGYPVQLQTNATTNITTQQLIISGVMAPPWTLESYMENRDQFGYHYSLMSITAPGVNFLKGNPAAGKLARRLNEQMAEWIRLYPTRLGGLCVLPIPDFEGAVKEISVCFP